MLIAVLLIIAKKWKQPRCSSTDERMNKMLSNQITEYCLALKTNEVLIHATAWMNLKNMLSERSPPEKITYCIIPSTPANCCCLTLTKERQRKKMVSGKLQHHGAVLCPGKMEAWVTPPQARTGSPELYTMRERLGEEYLPGRLNLHLYPEGHEIYQMRWLVKCNSREDEFGFRKATWPSQWDIFCTAAQNRNHQMLLPSNIFWAL